MANVTIFIFSILIATALGFHINDQKIAEPNSRVAGGANAGVGQVPYQVSIRSIDGHYCGGSIIDHHWILTSANCVHLKSTNQILVVVGTNSIVNGGEGYNVAQIIVHPNWNSNDFTNDIALIKTVEYIKYTKLVQPIILANNDTSIGQSAVLSGWGSTSDNGVLSQFLQTLNVFTIYENDCDYLVSNVHPITSNQVCTYMGQGTGACSGDFGGPLVSNNRLIGIASWGINCAAGNPDVFTKVFSYRD
ncbi:chymotrypsin-2-like [Ctenocephalides felis]|uniref:chymotrypsin-2-like n=1 Tax=Ctenocephalides felis TaxID=7515 RepID=UPI000E6E4F9D|nr:chymotrypsin-2-like [Ctenocephalides felis]